MTEKIIDILNKRLPRDIKILSTHNMNIITRYSSSLKETILRENVLSIRTLIDVQSTSRYHYELHVDGRSGQEFARVQSETTGESGSLGINQLAGLLIAGPTIRRLSN